MLSAFKNDAGFADMFDEMLLINQSKVSHFRTLVKLWKTPQQTSSALSAVRILPGIL